ncbi:superoxide dismutase [Fe], chloroplastic [Selaginella moellendorffii]|nr:superoxide dismutase [Fe], chloroplastic [Selaginella moellendorffii]|eukprot:XP_002970837.2 superoxide dismutase [Fe], chloroplastic [Selaginella moellendorffii]
MPPGCCATAAAAIASIAPPRISSNRGGSKRSQCNRGGIARAKFALPALPYESSALEPYMSKKTLEVHWGKHQRGYIENLNRQIANTPFEGYLLEDIVKISYNRGSPQPAFNNAAQAWNHDFFFTSLKPGGGKSPTGEIAELIDKQLGSYDNFVKEFKLAAASQFGAGWAWLALKEAKLVVEKTPNAINPLIWDHIPLLVLDVWEHAYYLDFQNNRPDYVSTFLEHLVNWDIVNARLDRAKAFMNWGEPDWDLFDKDADILTYEEAGIDVVEDSS